jgi:hypothetical protein
MWLPARAFGSKGNGVACCRWNDVDHTVEAVRELGTDSQRRREGHPLEDVLAVPSGPPGPPGTTGGPAPPFPPPLTVQTYSGLAGLPPLLSTSDATPPPRHG